MKNAFAVTSLILLAGSAVAVAAETLGFLSPNFLSVQTCFGIYLTASVLTLALSDYFRSSAFRERNARASELHEETVPTLHASTLASSPMAAH